ncbi:TetR/AcrR family transcriptional regulator [Mucilaginibacter sp. E4BP6]|uniref:TetR/AcrR family transcriptional regulator n=1 Tax=Mucilaginibacter sp. E4BP6 TaxID=2723089 RepID=UPI0015C7D6D8|nr:TetR/AcrR family transcriptional regulator [Mucilaginibacter sp. E4BP6]NYE64931.1 AcrR family transcriptional regulator [Mucilaginibacter sp. E4BP6]
MKDKEATKRKLIDAVGVIIKRDGFSTLKISTIAKVAEVDRKLIYRYFGGLNHLIEAYIVENDYWLLFSEKMKTMLEQKEFTGSEQIITAILQNQFSFFVSQKEMQRLILWELSADSPMMRSIHNARESMGQKFLEMTDSHFKESKVNFRPIAALLVGGIYYTILHTIFNGSSFTDMDINSEEGRQSILVAIEQIVHWAYIGAQ